MVLEKISDALQEGNSAEVSKLVKQAIDAKMPPQDILNDGLIDGMSKIGAKFKCNEVYVPEVLMAARAMHAGLNLLKPLLAAKGIQPKGKVILGTVRGDLHDIGKNLVGMMLQGAGFAVTDLGNDVPAERFIDAVKKEGATIVGLSALLTTTMPNMKDVIAKFVESGIRSKVKILVGGAPLTAEYAREIGADGYAPDAASAVEVGKQLLGIH